MLEFYVNTLAHSHLITESGPPRNVMATRVEVIKIRLTWDPPATPNGVITGYRVSQTVLHIQDL